MTQTFRNVHYRLINDLHTCKHIRYTNDKRCTLTNIRYATDKRRALTKFFIQLEKTYIRTFVMRMTNDMHTHKHMTVQYCADCIL